VLGAACRFFALTPMLVVVTVMSSITLSPLESVKVTVHEPASFAVTVSVVGLA
jgi:hypothetical protein